MGLTPVRVRVPPLVLRQLKTSGPNCLEIIELSDAQLFQGFFLARTSKDISGIQKTTFSVSISVRNLWV